MRIFTINDQFSVVCNYANTRGGFKHTATLKRDGIEIEEAKCTYLNRTWEAYEFESVLERLLGQTKALSEADRELFKSKIADGFKRDDLALDKLSTVAAVMALGNIFSDDQAGANDWKTRMLKAGIPDGLHMPEDWDQLSEDEKTKRLNGVIAALGEDTK